MPALGKRVALWLAGSASGGAIIALPDAGPRLVSLSATHGPSLVDGLGIVVVGSWLPLAVLLPRLWRSSGRATRISTAVLGVVGAAALVVTIRGDLGWSWLLAVVALVATQVWLLAAAPPAA